MSLLHQVIDYHGFVWPEALVIDVVGERYIGLVEPSAVSRVAKVHAALLQHIFENKLILACAIRDVLVSECERHGVSAKDIAAVDRCAFWEIAALVQRQMRSSRITAPTAICLHAAVCRLGAVGAAA